MGFLLVAYLLLLFVLNFGPAQRAVTEWTEKTLQKQLGTEVRLGGVEIGLFNHITLKEVALNDLQDQKLLTAALLSAKIEFSPLLKGEVSLRTVSLLDAKVRLYKTKADSVPNYQFLIDAFSSKEKKKEPSTLNLRINSLILRRCSVTYDALYQKRKADVLDLNHLTIKDIDANISLKRLTSDSISLRVRHLAFREQSGLDVRNLSLRLVADKSRCEINRLELTLPGSQLKQEKLVATYKNLQRDGLLGALCLSGRLDDAHFFTKDLICFIPELKDYDKDLRVTTDFVIIPNRIQVKNMVLREKNNELVLKADATLQRHEGRLVGARATVQNLRLQKQLLSTTYRWLTRKDAPPLLSRLDYVEFSGKGSYRKKGENSIDGTLQVPMGKVAVAATWKGKHVSGILASPDFQLAKLVDDKKLPDHLNFNAKSKVDFTNPQDLSGHIDIHLNSIDYRGVTYRNLTMNASLLARQLKASLQAEDPNLSGMVVLKGSLQGKKLDAGVLYTDIRRIQPQQLGLQLPFGDAVLSFRSELTAASLSSQRPQGFLSVKDFSAQSATTDYRLKELQLSLKPSQYGSLLNMQSDFADAEVEGGMSFAEVKECLARIVRRSLPGMLSAPPLASLSKNGKNEWRFHLNVKKTDVLSDLLKIPVVTAGTVSFNGRLRNDGGVTVLVGQADSLQIKGQLLQAVKIYLHGEKDAYSLLVQAKRSMIDTDVQLVAQLQTKEGKLFSNMEWSDVRKHNFSGKLSTITDFEQSKNGRSVHTVLLPTVMRINDSLWNIRRGEVIWNEGVATFNDLNVGNSEQGIKIDGHFSLHENDTVFVDVRRINLKYLFNILNFHPVDFDGLASGQIELTARKRKPQLMAALDVDDFSINGGLLGRAAIKGEWDAQDNLLELNAQIDDGIGKTKVDGAVSIKTSSLDLNIKSEKTNVRFLQTYFSDIFADLQGRASGQMRIYGPFKKLDFEGYETADVEARILSTGVPYRLTGMMIKAQSGSFTFDNASVSDFDKGTGMASGYVLHDHLRNMRYAFEADVNDLLIYNRSQSPDLPFNATAYGTGHISVKGRPKLFEADLNIRPERRTRFSYTIDSPDSYSDVAFLTLRDTTKLKQKEASRVGTEKDSVASRQFVAKQSQADVRLNFLIDMHPDVPLRIVMDEKAGDDIVAFGSGAIRAGYYNKGDFNMFGTFTIDRGTYRMSVQDVIRKDFQLERGGRIIFNGKPFDGVLDMKAVYVVNSASLSDLNAATNLSENSVRVNCILNFNGQVRSPQVKFDLDMPTVSDDVKQMVRALISTEEDMNMQVLYLLGVGRFYNYNFSQTPTAARQSQSSVAMKSLLANTLSGQLNDIIASAMGVSNWRLGTNLSTGQYGWSDMEVEGLLSGRLLNNRILLNGSFGYRDRTTSTNNFVGDFDLQYLLTPSGGVSLKAYSETNDRYFTKSTLTTQGIGIMFKRDFGSFKSLFQRKKRKQNK